MLQSLKDRFGFTSGPLGNSPDKPLLHPPEWPEIPRPPSSQPPTNYGLFARLPLELRQKILSEAFGNRTLHVDLTFDQPLTRKSRPKTDQAPSRHKHCGLGTELVHSTYRSKRWQWFGCVCHRRLTRPDKDDGGSVILKARIEPCDDACIRPLAVSEPIRDRDQSHVFCLCSSEEEDCFIGAVGWLLACRQAYLDGVDVLYRTNTLHIASMPLLCDLPRLMSPARLASVTSLELLWTFDKTGFFTDTTIRSIWDQARDPSSTPRQDTPFHELCQMVPRIFPNVRHLYVALQAYLAPPECPDGDALPHIERLFLRPVEEMFRHLGPAPGKEFSLAIQRGCWQAFANRLSMRGPREHRVYRSFDNGGSYQEWIWRPLGNGGVGYSLRPGWDDFAEFGHHDYWLLGLWGMDHFRGEF